MRSDISCTHGELVSSGEIRPWGVGETAVGRNLNVTVQRRAGGDQLVLDYVPFGVDRTDGSADHPCLLTGDLDRLHCRCIVEEGAANLQWEAADEILDGVR